MTTREQRITHLQDDKSKVNLKPCEHISHPSLVTFIHLLLFPSSLQAERLCALFWCITGERGMHLRSCIHDKDKVSTGLLYIYPRPLLFDVRVRYYSKWTEKKAFLKQTICGLELGNVMLGKEQGSSKQTNKQTNKRKDPSEQSYYTVIKW